MASFSYENRDIPDMTSYKATRMAFDSLLYPCRDPEKMVLMEVRRLGRIKTLKAIYIPTGKGTGHDESTIPRLGLAGSEVKNRHF